ncbi:hypothetical protein [Nocardia sp. NPDC058705]|uniref:hypothetical protein n=1 Tax=Nocardia sp. NPDC058705 TaxID=3346609 RepID=UPI003694C508
MRISVTGHMDINAATAKLVRAELDRLLAGVPDLVGVSCIARGADSVFADAVLAAGGKLEVVLPCRGYREAKVKPDHLEQFDRLLGMADTVREMPHEVAGRAAYEEANAVIVREADRLIAVWDGQPSQRGGTGTVVDLARAAGVVVEVVWPEGAGRGH